MLVSAAATWTRFAVDGNNIVEFSTNTTSINMKVNSIPWSGEDDGFSTGLDYRKFTLDCYAMSINSKSCSWISSQLDERYLPQSLEPRTSYEFRFYKLKEFSMQPNLPASSLGKRNNRTPLIITRSDYTVPMSFRTPSLGKHQKFSNHIQEFPYCL